jgi:integrase
MAKRTQTSKTVMLEKTKSPILVAVQTFKKRNRAGNKPLTQDQIEKIMSEVDNIRDSTILNFGFNVGCRVSEVRNFSQDSIDWQQKSIKIWDEKKNEYRDIYPPDETIQKIKIWINHIKPGPNPVFDYHWKTIERIIQKWSKKALGFQISWHSLRTTYVSLCQEKDVPVKVAMANTGDKLATIVKYYQKLSPGYMNKVVNANPIFSEKSIKKKIEV